MTNKESHTIPITLVLTYYETMRVIYALQRWADSEHKLGFCETSTNLTVLSDKIYSEVREQLMAFEDQNEEENPNPK